MKSETLIGNKVMQTQVTTENPIIIQTNFGAAVVERIAEGFFIATIGATVSTGRTVADAVSATTRIAQNLMLIERQNY